jgi:hypothetical protein
MDLKHLMIFAGCLLFISGHAQQSQFDSLYKANAGYNKQDEKKLRLLNKLSYEYQWRQLDSGIAVADRAIALSRRLKNPKELAVAYNNKAANSISRGNFSMAEELI